MRILSSTLDSRFGSLDGSAWPRPYLHLSDAVILVSIPMILYVSFCFFFPSIETGHSSFALSPSNSASIELVIGSRQPRYAVGWLQSVQLGLALQLTTTIRPSGRS